MATAALMPACGLRGSQYLQDLMAEDNIEGFTHDVGRLVADAAVPPGLSAPLSMGASKAGAARMGANFGAGALVAQGRGAGPYSASPGTVSPGESLAAEVYAIQQTASSLSASVLALARELEALGRAEYGVASLHQRREPPAPPISSLLELAARPRQLQLPPGEGTPFLPPGSDVARSNYPLPFLPPPDAARSTYPLPFLPPPDETLAEKLLDSRSAAPELLSRSAAPELPLQAEMPSSAPAMSEFPPPALPTAQQQADEAQMASSSATSPAAESDSSPSTEVSVPCKKSKLVPILLVICCLILGVLCCQWQGHWRHMMEHH